MLEELRLVWGMAVVGVQSEVWVSVQLVMVGTQLLSSWNTQSYFGMLMHAFLSMQTGL